MSHKLLDDLTERAKLAINKKAAFGEDIDLSKYVKVSEDLGYVEDLESLSDEEKERLYAVGVDTKENERSGSFVQHDTSVSHRRSMQEASRSWAQWKPSKSTTGLRITGGKL